MMAVLRFEIIIFQMYFEEDGFASYHRYGKQADEDLIPDRGKW